ncbi:MAG: hypothetical protein NT136_02210 [Candidatus Moranbacteria bacterium]|nr:hypothetical protein [Candidatus Moranbacteria bacterium]
MAGKIYKEYYVEPLDSNTNKTITDVITETGLVITTVLGVSYGFTKIHRVLVIDENLVMLLKGSKKYLRLRFRLFGKDEKGSVREIRVIKREKTTEKEKEALKKVEKLKEQRKEKGKIKTD